MHIEEMENISPLDAFASIRRMGSPFMLTWENRYSYVSASPLLTVRTENGRTTLEEAGRAPMEWPEPFSAISAVLKERGEGGKAPFPFATGFAGYYGYGLKDAIDPPAQAKARPAQSPALSVPDCVAGLYDPVFVHDRVERKGWLASRTGDKARLKAFRRALSEKAPEQKAPPAPFSGFTPNITKEEYLAAIARAKDYITAGDIYQINISQRLETPWDGDPFTLYAGLLNTRPAPFSSFLDYGSFQVVSNSPERLLKVTDGVAETCPIKGTRPRGKTPEEDRAHIEELGGN
ncbi:MAG: chorismate-binding protein, partial [Deltaproteobacteria bacterium]|nr:chorismate-binding protein [Deltaproteobacteria bacterium]